MKRRLLIAALMLALNSSHALASDMLEMACGSADTKAYCMMLLQGFLTGYKTGYITGTQDAESASGDASQKLCVPSDLTPEDYYEDMKPHLPEGLGFLDLSLFLSARKAYPCNASDDE